MNTGSDLSKPKPSKARQRERDDRRRRILEAAELVFSEHGYHDASVTEIARRSELAVGTIYLYFADKAELYGSLILEKMQQMVRLGEAALKSSDSVGACLRAWVYAQFSFHEANRTFFEIFLLNSQVQSSPLHDRHWVAIEKLKKRNLGAIEACIARGQERLEIKPGDTRLLAVAFLGITLQIIRQWIRDKGTGPLQDSAEFAANCFLNGAARSPSSL